MGRMASDSRVPTACTHQRGQAPVGRNMNRRSFIAGILAAGVAPAFIGSSVLMPVRTILTDPKTIWPPTQMVWDYDYIAVLNSNMGSGRNLSAETMKDANVFLEGILRKYPAARVSIRSRFVGAEPQREGT